MECFGNPSSLHRLGMKSEKEIKIAREYIAKYLDVNQAEIYFTSGGTESNNLAIQSALNKMKNRGNHIITTKIEHPSILNTAKSLEAAMSQMQLWLHKLLRKAINHITVITVITSKSHHSCGMC